MCGGGRGCGCGRECVWVGEGVGVGGRGVVCGGGLFMDTFVGLFLCNSLTVINFCRPFSKLSLKTLRQD